MKKLLLSATLVCIIAINVFAQNVGIGTTTPAYKLDVLGTIRGSGNAYFDGLVGIGTTSPSYLLQVNDGTIALFNTTDNKFWNINYNSSADYFQITEGGVARLVLENGGNVGIGNAAPTVKLHVTGSGRFTDNVTIEDNLTVNDNVTVDNNLTVDGGKGIIRNSTSGQLKYYTRTAAFNVALGPHAATTSQIYIAFSGFTNPPVAMVGNIVTSGGASGELYRCVLQLYNVTAAGCEGKIINTDDVAINQNITWNIICIGN